MNVIAIIELQMLGEHIKYLQDKNACNKNDELIKASTDAYKALTEQLIYNNTK